MAYCFPTDYVTEVMDELRNINHEVDRKKKEVHTFLGTLQSSMSCSGDAILRDITLGYSGSAFEGTAVSRVADYDILLLLPDPYVADNFQVCECYKPGVYKLRYYESRFQNQPYFINEGGFLESRKLRQHIFNELIEVLKDVKNDNPHWNMQYREMLNSMVVFITDSDGTRLKLDIVLQMGVPYWGQLDKMVPKGSLPSVLKYYVQEVQYPMLYNLATGYSYRSKADFHLLVSTSFSPLEKRCMRESARVREAVLLAKLVSQDKEWKKRYALRSFHFKRLAIKHYEELDALNTWTGFQRLLKYMREQLDTGKIEGFFIYDQDIFNKDLMRCWSLATEIRQVQSSIQPNNIWNLLPAP